MIGYLPTFVTIVDAGSVSSASRTLTSLKSVAAPERAGGWCLVEGRGQSNVASGNAKMPPHAFFGTLKQSAHYGVVRAFAAKAAIEPCLCVEALQ